MSDFLPCTPTTLATECCLQSIPNTSEWMVVCPRGRETEAAASIPAVSTLGLVVCAALIGTAAIRLIRA